MVAVKNDTNTLPNLSNITDQQIYNGMGKALLDYETAVLHVETMAEDGVRDLDALLRPLEQARLNFESCWHVANMLQLVTESLDRDRFIRLHLRAEKASLARVDSKSIYLALKEIKAKQVESGGTHLSAEDERLLDRHLMEYRHQGHHLPQKEYTILTENWLPKLTNYLGDYKYRQSRATERYRHVIRDPNVVRDFPVDVLKAMATDSTQPTRGPWTVSLHPYIHKQVMAYCPDRSVRWTTYLGDVMRGSKELDIYLSTAHYVRDIRKHRSDQAITLGYKNYAEYSMETKMAGSVENVQTMISTLKPEAKRGQETELEDLQNFAESRGFEEELEEYDIDFFRRKKKRVLLGKSDEDIREYFPMPKVVNGIFNLCSSMFSIRFEEINTPESSQSLWHPDVRLFRVIDLSPGADNAELGRFYLDPYIRDDKGYSGGDKGWYLPIRQNSPRTGTLPLGAFIFSLPMPNYGKPALLSMEEVEEVLRNFGNMLQHMLSNQGKWSEMCSKAGQEWDVLDLPGFFMQNWLYVPEVMRSLSGHWSTGQPLETDLVNKLCTVPRHLLAGYDLCRQLFFADFDISFYSVDWEKEGYQEMVTRLRSDYLLLPKLSRDHFPLYYSAMISGDYPAAIYSSLWAKMLAADAFSAVLEARDGSDASAVPLFDDEAVKNVTGRFRNTILAQGSTLPASDIYRKFRGRDPSHEALLHSHGLKVTPRPGQRGHES